MSSERVSFTSKIEGVDLQVKAVIFDGEIDEFTVYIGDNIVTELLKDNLVKQLYNKLIRIERRNNK